MSTTVSNVCVSPTPSHTPSRGVMVWSFGVSTALLAVFMVALMFAAAPAEATSYASTGTMAGTRLWSNPTNWSPVGVPNAGDDVTITGGNTFSLDIAINAPGLNSLTLNSTSALEIPAAGELVLGSTALNFTANGATMTLNGGKITIDPGEALIINTGSTLNFLQGTIAGGGTVLTVNGAPDGILALNLNGAATIDGSQIQNNGTITTNTTQTLTLQNAGNILNDSTGLFIISSALNINGTGGTATYVNNFNSITKTDATTSVINAHVINSANINVSSGAALELSGGGAHTGNFTATSPGRLDFSGGTHNMNNNFVGMTGNVRLTGGLMELNTPLQSINNFTQTGGTLDGNNNAMQINQSFTFSGGTQTGGGVTSLQGLATGLLDGAVGPMTLLGRSFHSNGGDVTYSAPLANPLNLEASGNINLNVAGGDLILTNDTPIKTTTSGFITVGAGTALRKTGGTGSSDIGVAVYNNGVVSNQVAATITLKGGGLSTGGQFTNSFPTANIDFAGGNYQVDAGTTFASGGFRLLAGTMTLLANVSSNNFTIDGVGATLQTTGGFAFDTPGGTFQFKRGVLSGNGSTTIGAGSTMSIGDSGATSMNGWKIVNNSNLNFPATAVGDLTMSGGATIDNENGAFLRFQTDRSILGTGTINNKAGAAFEKTGTSGTSVVAVNFVNNGTVDNQATNTVLRFSGGGTWNAGTINFSGTGSAVEFGGGTHNFNGTNMSGAGTAWLSTGTVNFNSNTVTTNWKQTGGWIFGSTTFTITNGGTWSGGTMAGTGTTLIANTASYTISGTTTLDTRSFSTQSGGAVLNFGAGATQLNVINGASLNNGSGSNLNLLDDGTMSNGGGSGMLNNSGDVDKSAGTLSVLNVTVNNSAGATIKATSGTIEMKQGGSLGGSLETFTSTAIKLSAGSFSYSGGSVIGAGKLILDGANLLVNAPLATQNVDYLSGGLTLSSTLTNSGTFNWATGTINGSAGLNANGTTNIQLGSSSPVLDTVTFTNGGTVNVQGTSATFPLALANSASLVNNGTVNLQGDRNLSGTGTFTNGGGATLRKTGGTGTSAVTGISFNNSGNVDVQSGRLQLPAGGESGSGIYTASSGTTLSFAGTRNFAATTTVGPALAGTVEFASGTAAFPGNNYSVAGTTQFAGGTASFDGTSAALGTLVMNGGTLGGSGGVNFAGGSWTFGTLSGSGLATNTSGTLTIGTNAGARFLNKPFTNSGTVTQNTAADLNVGGAGVITNNATWNLAGDVSITGTGGSFTNAGSALFRKTAGTTSNVSVPFTNNAAVQAQAGVLTFQGGGTHSGSFTSTSTIVFDSAVNTFNASSSITGGGSANFTGNATVNGTYSPATTAISAGAVVTFGSNASTSTLVLSNGTLTGAGNFTSNNLVTFAGGTVSGSGQFIVPVGATMQLTGSVGPMTFDARPVVLGGSASYTSAANQLSFANGATLTNNGTFNYATDTALNGAAGTSFTNNGTFARNSGTGTTTFGPAFTNTNMAQFPSGVLLFSNGYTQSAGTTQFGAGSSGFGTTSGAFFNGGVLTGIGSITGPLTNNGATIRPGGSGAAGNLSISGAATFNSGTLEIEIGGPGPGGSYDVLAIGSTAALGGNLVVTLINAYTPPNGTPFDIVTWTGFSGAFTETLPTWPGGGSFTSTNTATAKRLVAQQTQADIAVSQTNSPAIHGQNIVFTVVVANTGASAAAGVTFTDTFSGATFVSVSTTAGSCTGTGPINCNLGTIAGSSSVTVTLSLNANALGSITNSASATTTTFDANGANNTVTTTVTVAASADLALTITDAPDPVQTGNNVTYTATLTNNGPSSASSPTASFNLTGGTINSVAGGMICTNTATTVSCNMGGGNIGPGGSVTVTIVTQAGVGASMTLSGSATSSTGDPAAGNNSATQTTTITGSADVVLAITDAPDPAPAGSSVTYTATVTNSGPSTAVSPAASFNLTGGTITSVSGGMTCTNTATTVSCNGANIAAGGSVSVTIVAQAGTGASMILSGNTTSTTSDPSFGNNTASQTTTLTPAADLSITKSGPIAARPNTTITYTIVVKNNGPSTANAVVVDDPTPARLTFVSNTGACTTPFPCALGTMLAGETKTISAKYEVTSGGQADIVNTATVSSTTADPNSANNSDSATTDTNCANTAPSDLVPAAGATNVGTSGTLRWDHFAANSYRVFLGRAGSGCGATTPYRTVTSRFADFSGLEEGVEYEWRVEAVINGCPTTTSACQRFTVGRNCNATAPAINTPANGSVVQSPVNLSWSTAGVEGTTYQVFASVNGAASRELGTTSATNFTAALPDGSVSWFVIANAPRCAQLQSQTGQFIVCNTPPAPVASLIGQASSGQNYTLFWTGAEGASYEFQQADNLQFANARSTSTNQTQAIFRGTAVDNKATALYYRVRQKTPCATSFGPFSIPVRVIIVPLPPKGQGNPSLTAPAGSKEVIVQEIFIPGEPGNTAVLTFSAVADKPWLTVRPSSGILPPDGVTLEVVADPANLPNGTFTGTVIVTINTPANSRGQATNGTTVKSVPVSVSLVTPVTPVTSQTPPDNSLIIPSVGHLDGFNSHWQSDIRVTNTGIDKMQYLLTFTQAGADNQSSVKQTTIDIESGATTALDDIVRNWYGIGSIGDSANGILEIRPLSASTVPGGDPSVSLVSTVASSRTYNVTENGTLGQYIPAVPFSSFISKAAPDGVAQVLSLQQIAQSSAFRTNVGVVEAAGQAASVLLKVFNAAGQQLAQVPLDLAAGEQRQMNSLLSTLAINDLNDGRIEVEVTGGDGRVTAYASVVDSTTNDPLLVSGVPLRGKSAQRYVLPGVADLNTGIASWRTDMRVFNGGTTDQPATLTYYPQDDSGPKTAQVVVRAGEVKTLDNVLQSTFGLTNSGGAVHVTTAADSSLIVSGRTYNQTANGTYGQFVPAVTLAEAVGRGAKALEIQQVEDSVRFRTNVGFTEVSGRGAEVEVTVTLPDSNVSPKFTMSLPANSFRQMPVLQDLGLGNVYNARVTVKVIGGDGKVSAYGSVIDMTTQDPTYVPAQ